MRTQFRIVRMSNSEYKVQARGRIWIDFFWSDVEGFEYTNLADAEKDLDLLLASYRTKVVEVVKEVIL